MRRKWRPRSCSSSGRPMRRLPPFRTNRRQRSARGRFAISPRRKPTPRRWSATRWMAIRNSSRPIPTTPWPHASDAHRRLAFLAAAFEPPPAFTAMAYDLPPPPPEEIVYIRRPVLVFDDPVFAFAPPPPPPVIFLAPPPPFWVALPPPPPPIGVFVLPIPVYQPVPAYVRPPAYIAPPPPNNIIYNNVHNTVIVNNTTNNVTIQTPSGQSTTQPIAVAAAAPSAPTPAGGAAP